MYPGEFQNCCQLKQNALDQMQVQGELFSFLNETCWNNFFENSIQGNFNSFCNGKLFHFSRRTFFKVTVVYFFFKFSCYFL